ncbi:MAG: glycosyltransferase family 4 protein [Candidatus Marinimicrobia bacterium]|nr:glycosyltransferase family 4 protein [Candidatus Neomarinimicrobiota bacterium]
MKKVLYFYEAGHYPNPSKSGADRIFFVNAQGLKKAGYETVHIEIGNSIESSSGKQHKFILVPEVKNQITDSWLGQQYRRWLYPVLHPGQNNYSDFLACGTVKLWTELIDEYEPELLFFENIRSFLVFAKFKSDVPKIVCIHDLDYVLNYGKNRLRIGISKSGSMIKLFRYIQIKLQNTAERLYTHKLLKRASLLYVIGQNDYKRLMKINHRIRYIKCPVTIAPNERQLDRIRQRLSEPISDPVRVLHVGKMNASHNRKGLVWFLSECWPILRDKKLSEEFEIHFIGSTAGFSEELEKFQNDPQLHFRGFVDNLEEELIAASFMIVPPGFPTGVRTKLPEALAWGLPVITGKDDANGAGLDKEDPRILIADSAYSFAGHISKLITDLKMRNSMSHQALATWQEDFDAETAYDHVSDMVSHVHSPIPHRLFEPL